jgi:Flp pilus assembly protein protease CpaA
VSLIDLEHFIVPNRIVFPMLAVSVPLLVAAALLEGELGPLVTAVLGAVLASNGLLLINLISPRGMGMGDVKLALLLGLFLGWLGLGHVALGLFLGFLFGAVGGILLIAPRDQDAQGSGALRALPGRRAASSPSSPGTVCSTAIPSEQTPRSAPRPSRRATSAPIIGCPPLPSRTGRRPMRAPSMNLLITIVAP